jgi:uncharacterized protein (UPF0332 family)
MKLTKLDDCFAAGKLRRVPSSGDKAHESLDTAREYLREAELVAGTGSFRLAMNGIYMACFHAARAVLFRDGIREKSHYCIGRYLEIYTSSGEMDAKWVNFFDRVRKKREENQYSCEVPPSEKEIHGLLELAGEFIGIIENLMKKPRE